MRQAKKLADRLKGEKIDFIFSSDLARAADTAVEISLYHPEAKLEFTTELRERNMGDLTGKNRREVNLGRNDSITLLGEIKNGETLKDLHKRAEGYLHKILKQHPQNTVVFVGHNGINKAMIAVVTRKKHEDIATMENLHNTSVNIFEIDENKNHKIHLLNDIEHLK